MLQPGSIGFADMALSTVMPSYARGLDISMATSSVDNALLLLRNPAGSGITIWLYRITLGVTPTNTAAEFKLFGSPTITVNGTTQTAYSRNIGGNFPTASGLLTSLPTISVNGNLMKTVNIGQNSNSLVLDERFSFAIQPNNSILITGNPTSNARNAAITLCWTEVPYGI